MRIPVILTWSKSGRRSGKYASSALIGGTQESGRLSNKSLFVNLKTHPGEQVNRDKDFCGCCGGEMEAQTEIWCKRCKAHVQGSQPFWKATWYAQTGKYCPFTTTQFVPFTKKELKARGIL